MRGQTKEKLRALREKYGLGEYATGRPRGPGGKKSKARWRKLGSKGTEGEWQSIERSLEQGGPWGTTGTKPTMYIWG